MISIKLRVELGRPMFERSFSIIDGIIMERITGHLVGVRVGFAKNVVAILSNITILIGGPQNLDNALCYLEEPIEVDDV